MNSPAKEQDVPLCVDLDGTLVCTDMLVESALSLLHRNPLYLFAFVVWLVKGKAYLKQKVAERAHLDATALPYDDRVVELVRANQGRRRVILCTASNQKWADAVAEHVGGFVEVLASDGQRNLSGVLKAQLLVERYGTKGFDYAGNERVDLHVWRQARKAYIANASNGVIRDAAKVSTVEVVLSRQGGGVRSWIRALRLHQWLKNLLVFLPLLVSHRVFEMDALARSMQAFLAFGLCASGVYLLNDLLDLDADRRHPRKRRRPFARGSLPVAQGFLVFPLLTLVASVLAFLLNYRFLLVLLVYYLLTNAYSFRLKRIAMLDVMVLAGLYSIRVVAGAVAINAPLSFWLLAFSVFIFLSLAILKRYTELRAMLKSGEQSASGRGYAVDDLPLLQSLGVASGYLSVLVLALYINSTDSDVLYRRPDVLWLLCPALLYWVGRAWLVAHRGRMHDDPIIFAVTDRVSQAMLVIFVIIIFLAI
jgi:4-hydroxybenzoate polyprenyltransferase